MRCLAKARAELGTTSFGIGEFVFGAKDYDTWHRWFTEKFAADLISSHTHHRTQRTRNG